MTRTFIGCHGHPPGKGEGAPLDVNVLKALVGDDPEVIRDFLRDAAKMAAELKSACDGGQAAQAGTLAHKLKSSARSMGALALGELAQKWNGRARQAIWKPWRHCCRSSRGKWPRWTSISAHLGIAGGKPEERST